MAFSWLVKQYLQRNSNPYPRPRLTLLPVTSASKYDPGRLNNIFTYFDTAQRLFLGEQLQLHFCPVYFRSLGCNDISPQ